MFRKKFLQAIERNLTSDSRLETGDFTITQSKDDNNEPRLRLAYAFNADYFLDVVFEPDPNRTEMFFVTLSPGNVLKTESVTIKNEDSLLQCARNWSIRVREELDALPFLRETEEIRNRIKEMEERISEFPDEYFSREEANEIKRRLDEVESKLKEHITKSTTNEEEAKEKTTQIEKDVQFLKAMTDGQTKRNWIGSMLVRVAKWMGSPEGQQVLVSGTEVAKHLLGDGKTPVSS